MSFTPFQSIAATRRLLRSKEISPVELLEGLEQRIASVDSSIGAYIARDLEIAKKEAASADLSKPLGGIPIGIKDAISVAGQPLQSASRILDGYTAPYDATAIARLRSAGAIPFGRMNMDEFAMGSSTENSAFHPTRNPWDLNRIPGGSSGGSAAAVASGTALATLGSDTGGSIRQPAALCGCVGLKPTYGRVSRYGLIAFASSLDQIGPLTSTVEDSGILLNAMAGKDPHDSTSLELPDEDFTAEIGRDLKGLRVGVPRNTSWMEWSRASAHPSMPRSNNSSPWVPSRWRSHCLTPSMPSRSTTSSPLPRPRPTWPASTGFAMVAAHLSPRICSLFMKRRVPRDSDAR